MYLNDASVWWHECLTTRVYDYDCKYLSTKEQIKDPTVCMPVPEPDYRVMLLSKYFKYKMC